MSIRLRGRVLNDVGFPLQMLQFICRQMTLGGDPRAVTANRERSPGREPSVV